MQRSTIRRTLARCLALVATLAAFLGAHLLIIQIDGNFHAVVAGELYRSAQPSPEQLENYAQRYGIRTVVNLRGTPEKAAWYRNEIATAEKLGLNYIDFPMNSSRELTPARADRLVALLGMRLSRS